MLREFIFNLQQNTIERNKTSTVCMIIGAYVWYKLLSLRHTKKGIWFIYMLYRKNTHIFGNQKKTIYY